MVPLSRARTGGGSATKIFWEVDMKLGLSAFAGMLAASIAMTGLAQAETLKASHQFPGGKGDARARF